MTDDAMPVSLIPGHAGPDAAKTLQELDPDKKGAESEPTDGATLGRLRVLATFVFVWGVWALMTLILLDWVWNYTCNVPHWDDWILVPAITNHEPMTLAWLFEPYDVHRAPLTRLFFVLLVKLTDDFRSLLYVNVLALSGLAAVLMWAARGQRGWTSCTDAFFPLIWLNLSLVRIFWWAIYFTNVVPLVLAGIVFVIIVRGGMRPRLRAAALAGVCMALLIPCGGMGLAFAPPLAVWLGGCGVLAWRSDAPHGKRDSLVMLVFAALTLVEVGVYFYTMPPHNRLIPPTVGAVFETALKMIEVSLGRNADASGPRVPYIHWATLGLLLVSAAGFVLALWRGQSRERSQALGLFFVTGSSLALVLAVAYGRTGMGENYQLMAIPTLCAVYLLGAVFRPAVIGCLVQTALFLIVGYAAFRNDYEIGFTWGWGPGMRQPIEAFEADLQSGTPPYLLLCRHQPSLYPAADYDPNKFGGYQRVLGWHGNLAMYLSMLRDARVGNFRHLGKNPPFQEEKLPLVPAALHDITWQDGTAVVTGDDPYITFALPEARFVSGVRVTYTIGGGQDYQYIRVAWGTDALPHAGLFVAWDSYDSLPNPEAGGAMTATVWVCDTIQQLRIHLGPAPHACQIAEIVLLTAVENP